MPAALISVSADRTFTEEYSRNTCFRELHTGVNPIVPLLRCHHSCRILYILPVPEETAKAKKARSGRKTTRLPRPSTCAKSLKGCNFFVYTSLSHGKLLGGIPRREISFSLGNRANISTTWASSMPRHGARIHFSSKERDLSKSSSTKVTTSASIHSSASGSESELGLDSPCCLTGYLQ